MEGKLKISNITMKGSIRSEKKNDAIGARIVHIYLIFL